MIKNQWASHPTIKERIKRLESTNFSSHHQSDSLANDYFKGIEDIQKQLTVKLFESVNYQGEANYIAFDSFQNEYKTEVLVNSFPKIYNGYYDNKNPSLIELNHSQSIEDHVDIYELFSDDKIDIVYTAIALKNDLETLNNIKNNSIPIKTFDYDGIRYKQKNTNDLIEKLKTELEQLNEQNRKNDTNIYEYFIKLENEQNRPKELERLYGEFFEFDKIFDSKYDIYIKLLNELQFVTTTTPFEQIKTNFSRIEPIEEKLKAEINRLLSDSEYQTEITTEIKQNLERYTSKAWDYFIGNHYDNENLNILSTAMHNYAYLLARGYFIKKKKLLLYQEELAKAILDTTHSQ